MLKRIIYISITVFVLLAAFWFYACNRYLILSFSEERQLFRTGLSYFYLCVEQPGGLIRYTGAFLTQFYRFFLLGATILSLALGAVYGAFMWTGRKQGDSGRFFVLPFIVPVCLLFACSEFMLFGLQHILGILWALILFGLYLLTESGKQRYFAGILLYFVAYFTAGGNALLFAALLLAEELSGKKPVKSVLPYAVTICISAVLIPFAAYSYIYVTPINTAYFALTPFDYRGTSNGFYIFAWLSVPSLYLVRQIFGRRYSAVNIRKIRIMQGLCVCLLAGYVCFGINRTANPAQEKIMRMAYHTEHGNWDAVLADGSTNSEQNWNVVPVTYFTNIALSEKGKLVSDMFKYRQTGIYGMFLAWESDYRIYLYTGELYYRLGIVQEARHCAFEASIADYGSKAMRRLVYTSMLMRDTPMFEKYIRLFDKSPVYRKWAGEQREHYRRYLADSMYVIPGTAAVLKVGDFSMNYNYPRETLMNLMKTNPQNKKVFEELLACLLLDKNMEAFFEIMENYYQYMDYEVIPRHIEEALLICENVLHKSEYIAEKYPIRLETRARIFALLKDGKAMTDRELQKKYGDTYTCYYIKVNPILLDEVYNSVY